MDEVAPPRLVTAPAPHRRAARGTAFLLLALILLFQAPSRGATVGRQASEYEVKAAFLLNFIKFIEWPEDKAASERPFQICILGDDPFGPALDQIVEGEQVHGRKLAVRRIREFSRSCEVLYVGKSEQDIAPLLAGLPRGVLTVGETDDFLRRNGIIAFVIENRRVRFDIDARAAARVGLRISSKLLNVARAVEKPER